MQTVGREHGEDFVQGSCVEGAGGGDADGAVGGTDGQLRICGRSEEAGAEAGYEGYLEAADGRAADAGNPRAARMGCGWR